MLSACNSLLHAIVQYPCSKAQKDVRTWLCRRHNAWHISMLELSQNAYVWEESTITTAGAVTLCITAQCNDGAWHGLCVYIWLKTGSSFWH